MLVARQDPSGERACIHFNSRRIVLDAPEWIQLMLRKGDLIGVGLFEVSKTAGNSGFLLQISTFSMSHRFATAGIGIAYALKKHNFCGLSAEAFLPPPNGSRRYIARG